MTDVFYCEAGVGVDDGHDPVVVLCNQPAELYRMLVKPGIQVPLCEEHGEFLAREQKVVKL